MKKAKAFFTKCWQSTALRNLGNVLVSVALSSVLAQHGIPPQDAAAIGQAAGQVITVQ